MRPPQRAGTVPLSELCHIQGGMPGLKPDQYADAGLPVVRPVDLGSHRVTSSPSRHITVEDALRWRNYALVAGDLLMTRSGTVGRVAQVTPDEEGWLCGPSLIRLRTGASGSVDPGYLLAFLSSTPAQDWIRSAVVGSTGVQHLSIRLLGELPVRLPPLEEQRRVGRVLGALDEKIRAHEDVVRATRVLREALADTMTAGEGA
ncbi:restriction endonuclease subunit S [Streptomyces cinereoruber]|nr:restriction endonuclease subunit S [Streptomyces cinereoruber]QEV33974.1 restriction endonuclease subunit S [Streptomyces cinereoruber]